MADDLEQYAKWRPLLHDLGACEVKHGVSLALFNLYSDEFGNPEMPKKFVQDQQVRAVTEPKVDTEKPAAPNPQDKENWLALTRPSSWRRERR